MKCFHCDSALSTRETNARRCPLCGVSLLRIPKPKAKLNETLTGNTQEAKKRQELATLYLGFLMMVGFISAIANFALGLMYDEMPALSQLPLWSFYVSGLLSFGTAMFALNLLQWQKKAFYAFLITTILASTLCLHLGLVVPAIIGPIGLFLLWAILHMGTPNTWSQLEW